MAAKEIAEGMVRQGTVQPTGQSPGFWPASGYGTSWVWKEGIRLRFFFAALALSAAEQSRERVVFVDILKQQLLDLKALRKKVAEAERAPNR